MPPGRDGLKSSGTIAQIMLLVTLCFITAANITINCAAKRPFSCEYLSMVPVGISVMMSYALGLLEKSLEKRLFISCVLLNPVSKVFIYSREKSCMRHDLQVFFLLCATFYFLDNVH